MSIFNRTTLKELVKETKNGDTQSVYLFCGDRYLCQQAADKLTEALCLKGGTVHAIDGESEDINTTIAKLKSFSLLPGKQIFRVNDSRLFHSKKIAKSLWSRAGKAQKSNNLRGAAGYLRAMMDAGGLDSTDPDNNLIALSPVQWKKCFSFTKPGENLDWTTEVLSQTTQGPRPSSPKNTTEPPEQLQATLEAGIPQDNILILLAEEVDKRKKLYKFFKKSFVIVDLSIDTGSSFQAKKGQRAVLHEQILQVLSDMGKNMAPQVVDQLIERVGFHPVAVVMETEKVALYTGENNNVTLDDLNAVVGRTRQEALFELTQAIGDQYLDDALAIVSRLQENGSHGLAILATLRNFTRKLLLFRALQDQQKYEINPHMPAKVFQQRCLPLLKENTQWPKELSGHPYALYMQFKTASSFSLGQLRQWLQVILEADMKLKGSPIATDTVLQHVIITMTS